MSRVLNENRLKNVAHKQCKRMRKITETIRKVGTDYKKNPGNGKKKKKKKIDNSFSYRQRYKKNTQQNPAAKNKNNNNK